MIDRRGQLGDFLAWRADARLAVAVREAEQGALVRDIEAAVHEREAVGRVEILDAGRAQFRLPVVIAVTQQRSEENTSELQSLMRISYAVFCLKKKTDNTNARSIDILTT